MVSRQYWKILSYQESHLYFWTNPPLNVIVYSSSWSVCSSFYERNPCVSWHQQRITFTLFTRSFQLPWHPSIFWSVVKPKSRAINLISVNWLSLWWPITFQLACVPWAILQATASYGIMKVVELSPKAITWSISRSTLATRQCNSLVHIIKNNINGFKTCRHCSLTPGTCSLTCFSNFTVFF